MDKVQDMLASIVTEQYDKMHVDWTMVYYSQNRTLSHVNFTYELAPQQLVKRQTELYAAADKIIADMPKNISEFQKAVYFHDYIIRNCTYTLKGPSYNISSAYGALVNGSALCQGYAQAFALLCEKAGISTAYATGNVDKVAHMWNKVLVDKKWYNMDVTWDDPDYSDARDMTYYRTCLVPDSDLSKDRQALPQIVPPPVATSMDQNYFVKTGQYISSLANAETVLKNAVYRMMATADLSAEVRFSGRTLYEQTYRDYFDNEKIFQLSEEIALAYNLQPMDTIFFSQDSELFTIHMTR